MHGSYSVGNDSQQSSMPIIMLYTSMARKQQQIKQNWDLTQLPQESQRDESHPADLFLIII
jgi:hypothetical protein